MDVLPILAYRDFWDVPRVMVVVANDRYVLLDSRFDDSTDDWGATYTVYVLPGPPPVDPASDWSDLALNATQIGTVSAGDVEFDPSKRAAMRCASLAMLLDEGGAR